MLLYLLPYNDASMIAVHTATIVTASAVLSVKHVSLLLLLLLLLLLRRRRRRLLLLARAGGVIAVAAARRRAAPRRLLYGCHRGTPLPLLWVAPPAQLVVELPVLDLAAVVHIDLIEESIRLLTRHVPQPEQGQPLAELLLGDGAGAVAIPLPEDLYK